MPIIKPLLIRVMPSGKDPLIVNAAVAVEVE
jgi:hypothetical protein